MSATGPVIFCFHRDLRLEDNTGLIEAHAHAAQQKTTILPIFIFTPEQVGPKSPVRSLFSIAALFQSLEELDAALKKHNSRLHIFYGPHEKVVPSLLKTTHAQAFFENQDYTPYAKQRTQIIQDACTKADVHYEAHHDLYLHPPGTILNKSKRPFQKFTPFYDAAKTKPIDHPRKTPSTHYDHRTSLSTPHSTTLQAMKSKILGKRDLSSRAYQGGRAEALQLLKALPRDYEDIHDALPKTTSGLSVHHHYGTISIRESYYRAEELVHQGHKQLRAFQRQLFWRDFYGNIVAFFEDLYGTDPYEYQKEDPHWNKLSPEAKKKKKDLFQAWCDGTTGIPLVDAGMNQLNTTGFMHNRARLACASWLVKDAHIHWRWGERYFADHLVDYDFSQNFGNWVWVASLLPFSQAPFRKHDPITIAKRLDPDNEYIDKWSPN
jgi:deoxyribodipyrimidine photo-lyase